MWHDNPNAASESDINIVSTPDATQQNTIEFIIFIDAGYTGSQILDSKLLPRSIYDGVWHKVQMICNALSRPV